MRTRANNSKAYKSRAVSNTVVQKQDSEHQNFGFKDNRNITSNIIQGLWVRHNGVRIKGHPTLLNGMNPAELTSVAAAVHQGLHQTANARGNTGNAIGYVHCYATNHLYLVRSFNPANNTIVLIGTAPGRVNGGVHQF